MSEPYSANSTMSGIESLTVCTSQLIPQRLARLVACLACHDARIEHHNFTAIACLEETSHQFRTDDRLCLMEGKVSFVREASHDHFAL